MPHPITTSATPVHRSHGFDLIRIIAALMVLVGHTFVLSRQPDPGFLDSSISTIGVKIFFITSGYLVSISWFADPSPIRFASRRLLRIMPGLAGVIILTVLILGPLLSSKPLLAYFGDRWTWFYLWNVALYPVYSLPGMFLDNPYPFAVNGSLWSLPVEVLMYALLPFAIGQGRKRARWALPLIACVASVAAIWCMRWGPPVVLPVFYGTAISPLLEVSCYFAIGSVWALFGWQQFARPVVAVALLATAAWLAPMLIPLELLPTVSELALMVLLPFVVISCGVQRFAWFDRPAAFGDISYGLYLYAFPVQQSILALSHGQLGVLAVTAIAVPITAVCAALSWRLIERSAMALKPTRQRSAGRRPAFSSTPLATSARAEPQTPRG